MCVCISLSIWVSQDGTQELLVHKLLHLHGISHVVVPRYLKPQIFSTPPGVSVSCNFCGNDDLVALKMKKAVEKGWKCNAVYLEVCRWFEMFNFSSENRETSYTHSIGSDWEKEVFLPSRTVGNGARSHNWCISFLLKRHCGIDYENKHKNTWKLEFSGCSASVLLLFLVH